jgi:hypothetical protein
LNTSPQDSAARLTKVEGMRTKLSGLALAAVLAAPAPAVAHDHLPPRAVLVTDTDSGEGTVYTSSWARRAGKHCSVVVGGFSRLFEEPPVQWVPGTDIAVRFEKHQRPSHVIVRGFLLGDPTTGTAIYGRVRVPHELRRVEDEGKRMWEAVLSPPPWPDLWLDVQADWEDEDGCGGQHVGWRFRAGLLPV